MRRLSLFFFFSVLFFSSSFAQSGCPGCLVDLPILPEDTIFNTLLPDATKGQNYTADLSFRLPKTTTPVSAYDSTTPPNLPIEKFIITGIDSLPAGLRWTANAAEYDPDVNKDGCIRFCGTPIDTGTFEMIVRLDVTVFIVTRPANFRVKIHVAPAEVTNDGFTMLNPEGCGSVTVDFVNNHPSNGVDGFSYAWDFGDSTFFFDENPPAYTYTEPGQYIVQYQALADTAGFTLADIEVLDVDCVDNLGLGAPDVYIRIEDAVGAEVFNSSPYINNISLPYTFLVDLDLGIGNYTIEVWDEDSGLKGSDDLCGIVSFSVLSPDTLSDGDLLLNMNIQNPITEVLSQDTVRVYPQPAVPTIDAPNGLEICAGSGEIFLFSSSANGNTWWRDGNPIVGANDFSYEVLNSGIYQVETTTSAGCSAISDSVAVAIHPLPNATPFSNQNNHLFIADSVAAMAYAVQWFYNGDTIGGASSYDICAIESGLYSYELTNIQTGCSNTYSATVEIDPNFDCTVSATNVTLADIEVFPNPVYSALNVKLSVAPKQGTIRLFDALGRPVMMQPLEKGTLDYVLPVGGVAAGLYILVIDSDSGAFTEKILVRD